METTTTPTATIDSLKAEKAKLIDKLTTREERPDALEKIKTIDEQIKGLEHLQLLTRVNREQAEKRDLARLVYEAEQPRIDITNANGTFHATKVKNYPKLAALQYGRATWKDGRLTTIKAGREEFTMYRTKYEYNQPTQYTRPETFEDFLSLNGIAAQDITYTEYCQLIDATEENNKRLEEAINAHSKTQSDLNLYFYSSIGLFEQRNAGHVYKFNAKH